MTSPTPPAENPPEPRDDRIARTPAPDVANTAATRTAHRVGFRAAFAPADRYTPGGHFTR